MKKVVFTLVLMLGSYFGFSQYRGGMEAGFNVMSADFELNNFGTVDTKSSWGIRLGYVGEYALSENHYLRFGALINQRGFKLADERWALTALDFPLNIGYLKEINNGSLQLFVDGGLNLEYNVRATTKLDGDLVELTIGGEEDDIKPLAVGVNLGIGVQLKENIKIRTSYYRGLTNLLRTDNDSWKNSVFGFALNFFMPAKK